MLRPGARGCRRPPDLLWIDGSTLPVYSTQCLLLHPKTQRFRWCFMAVRYIRAQGLQGHPVPVGAGLVAALEPTCGFQRRQLVGLWRLPGLVAEGEGRRVWTTFGTLSLDGQGPTQQGSPLFHRPVLCRTEQVGGRFHRMVLKHSLRQDGRSMRLSRRSPTQAFVVSCGRRRFTGVGDIRKVFSSWRPVRS